MRSFLLKLIVLLFCVQRGTGHWIRSLLEQRRESAFTTGSPDGDETMRSRAPGDDTHQGQSSGIEPSAHHQRPTAATPAAAGPSRRSRRSASHTDNTHCSLRSVLLRVRDLGLGYDSDETIPFKYCGGTCPRVRSNHDLTLSNLLQTGVLPEPAPEDLGRSAPCCRPTHHEDMAFLDNSHRWHKVEKLSAAGCSCVG